MSASRQQKWLIAFVLTGLAALLYNPQFILLLGYAPEGFGFPPQVKISGAASIGLFLVITLLFFLLTRLIFYLIPMASIEKWRYSAIFTIAALLIFAPFFTSAFDNSALVFLIQLIVFLLIIRLFLS